MIKKSIIALLFVVGLLGSLKAETIKIYGYATSFKGRTIALEVYDDYFTFSYKKLAESPISGADGSFMMEVTIEETVEAFLKIGQHTGIIYLSPNTKEYHVVFSEESPKAQYLKPIYVDVAFVDLPDTDINELILHFNEKLDEVLYPSKDYERDFSYILDSTFNKRVDSFRLELPQMYKHVNNAYFYNYMRYSLASLELLSNTSVFKSKLMVFNQHLELEPVLYYHDMYMRLFHQFFDGELKSLSREKRNNLMYFINEGNYTKALEAIELLYTKRIDLRELVLIKSLTEAYISNECEKAGIVSILNAIAETSRFEHNKTIAKNTLHTLTRLDVGQKAPSFRFQTEQGEIKSISDFKGKYVYINFVAAWCSECLTELQAIKGVQERYGDMVEFVTIFVDEDLQRFKRYITSNSFKWHVAHFNYSYELLSLYNVKTLPSYYLIDVEGNLLQSPALKPIPKGNSPSVDFTFFNIKKGGKK